jgi:hypothetical protein
LSLSGALPGEESGKFIDPSQRISWDFIRKVWLVFCCKNQSGAAEVPLDEHRPQSAIIGGIDPHHAAYND